MRVDQAEKVFLTLAENSENHMESGEVYSQAALEDGTGGVIFAHDDLSINGSGSLEITANYKHGIDANDDLVIAGGSVRIVAAADAIHCSDSFRMAGTALSLQAGDDGVAVTGEEGLIYVRSGSLAVDCVGDAMHCAGNVLLEGGDLTFSAGDDGIHADKAVSISDGSLLLSQCYEGIEAPTIEISGGGIAIYPVDDALNANGRSGGFADFGRDRQSEGKEADDDTWIHISGGTLLVVNQSADDADGLDSNGDILISGGTVLISLVNGSTNCAIDYASENGGVCEISGGTVIACGSYSMAEGFDATSSQCSILYNISSGVPADNKVSLLDESGAELLSWQVPCSFSSVILSCPDMLLGESYVVRIGDNEETITLSEVSASFGDAASSMFGGAMNWGGIQPRGSGSSDLGEDQPQPGDEWPSDREESPVPPDGNFEPDGMPDMGERPTPPDGNFDPGDMPEMGEMPTPPDGNFEPGDMPEMGEMPTPPDGDAEQAWDVSSEDALDDSGSDSTRVSVESEVLVAACALALLAAILLVSRFRRHG